MNRIVPENKYDFEACSFLEVASDDEVLKHIDELLEWVQNINWPVANKVLARVSKLDKELIDPIIRVLNTNDGVWKYFVISNLARAVNLTVFAGIRKEIERIALKPTESEIQEEVSLVAQEVLQERGSA